MMYPMSSIYSEVIQKQIDVFISHTYIYKQTEW